MKERPGWLPAIVAIDGVWEDVLSRLYDIFDRDFKQLKPMFSAMQVWWDQRVLKENVMKKDFGILYQDMKEKQEKDS